MRRRTLGALIRLVHFAVPAAGAVGLLIVAVATVLRFARGLPAPGTAIFRVPALSTPLAWIESTLPALLLVWAVAGATLGYAIRFSRDTRLRRSHRRSDLRLRRLAQRFGLIFCLGLFLVSLMRLWTETTPVLPTDAQTDVHEYSAFLGYLPWSDANGYYWGGRHLLDTGQLDYWAERRPINAALLSVRMALTHLDVRSSILLQVLLLAVATFLAGRAVGRRLGLWSGVATVAITFAYARVYHATLLSEPLGLALSALGTALLYGGIADATPWMTVAGLFGLSLAMTARPGAIFCLPCILLFEFVVLRWRHQVRRRVIAAAVAAMLAGSLWSPLLNRFYGTGKSVAFSNFSYTLVGLAIGGSWLDAGARYAEPLKALPTDREKFAFMYRQAFALIRQDPPTFFNSLATNETEFLDSVWHTMTELVFAQYIWLAAIVVAVLLVGIVRDVRTRRREWTLWLGLAMGLLLSMPLIFGDGGWRVVASTWPLMAAFLATGLALPPSRLLGAGIRRPWRLWRDSAVLILTGLAVTAAVGPVLARPFVPRPPLDRCPAAAPDKSLMIVERPAIAPSVVIIDRPVATMPGVPVLDVSQFEAHLQRSRMEDSASLLPPPARPFLMFWAYDFLSQLSYPLVAPAELSTIDSDWVWLRVAPFKDATTVRQVVGYSAWRGCTSVPPPAR